MSTGNEKHFAPFEFEIYCDTHTHTQESGVLLPNSLLLECLVYVSQFGSVCHPVAVWSWVGAGATTRGVFGRTAAGLPEEIGFWRTKLYQFVSEEIPKSYNSIFLKKI